VGTADGRTLTYAEWGDPEGFPVFTLHGTPGSRFARHYDESAYVDAGARVITYDRPGYGGSSRHRGRRIVDCVPDVEALADALGIERFAIIGGSGGGPHALAVAARLPERVTRVACAVGIVPFDTQDFDWFEGMDPNNVKEFGWALEGEDVLARRQHGEWLANNVPNAEAEIEDGRGHAWDPALVVERYRWLVGSS
jgi:pimeloyl-ACP methyl ester carboxylesterase